MTVRYGRIHELTTPCAMTTSFRKATLCLWAAALVAGSFTGRVPVRWSGGRVLALPMAAVLASSALCLGHRTVGSLVVVRQLGKGFLAWHAFIVGFESLSCGLRRHKLALLLNCLKQYLDVHPLDPKHWNAFFLWTAAMAVLYSVAGTLLYISVSMLNDDVLAIAVGAFVVPRMITYASFYWRLQCPMALLGAAAADLRVECTRQLQAACEASRPLDSHVWRALRQRQFLLHDMLRQASDVNGPCLFNAMAHLFLITTPSLGATLIGRVGSSTMLLVQVHAMLSTVVTFATCARPAVQVKH